MPAKRENGAPRGTSIIPRQLWEAIQHDLDLSVSSCLNWRGLAQRHGVCLDTLASIYSQEMQNRIIKTHHIHKAHIAQYTLRYQSGEDALAICADVDFPPCLLMRRMLEHLLRLPKQRIGDILRHPELLAPCTRAACINGDLAGRLARDLDRCARADRSYSPLCDVAKAVAGVEHEARLWGALRASGLPFWGECDLRAQDLFKTPDARLQVPALMRAPGSGSDGWRTVCWIDSKATFGDERSHAAALGAQYQTYVNRYGPGAVIYWFGYVAELAESDPGVLLLDAFPAPADILTLPQLTGAPACEEG